MDSTTSLTTRQACSLSLADDLRMRAIAKMGSFLSLEELLNLSRPMQLAILEHADVHVLAGLASVSSYGCALTASAIRARWREFVASVNPLLSGDEFVRVMRESGTVLSGGGAVHFFAGERNWIMRDVDFFCGRSGYETFCIYVIDRMGGTVIKHETLDDLRAKHATYYNRGISERRVILTAHATFDILCSSTLSPLTPITNFYGSHLMNYVSADALCIAYPRSFFNHAGIVRNSDDSVEVRHGIEKWRERGFTLVEGVWATGDVNSRCNEHDSYCRRALRAFGDAHCLLLRFPEKASSSFNSASMGNGAWTSSWVFGGDACGNQDCTLQKESCEETAWIVNGASVI